MKKLCRSSDSEEKNSPSGTAIPKGDSPILGAGAWDNIEHSGKLSRQQRYALKSRLISYLGELVQVRHPRHVEIGGDYFLTRWKNIVLCGLPYGRELALMHTVAYGWESFRVSGIICCGSILCPVCSPCVRSRRQGELAYICQKFPARSHLIFTFSHQRGEALSDLRDVLSLAYRDFWMRPAVRNILKECGYHGRIRAIESPFGINGWHPHVHCLFLSDIPIPESAETYLQKVWKSCLQKYGRDCDLLTGLKIQDGSYAQKYIVKLGAEMTHPETKDSKDWISLLMEHRKSLVREFYQAFSGYHWIRLSPGLGSLSAEHESRLQIERTFQYFKPEEALKILCKYLDNPDKVSQVLKKRARLDSRRMAPAAEPAHASPTP